MLSVRKTWVLTAALALPFLAPFDSWKAQREGNQYAGKVKKAGFLMIDPKVTEIPPP